MTLASSARELLTRQTLSDKYASHLTRFPLLHWTRSLWYNVLVIAALQLVDSCRRVVRLHRRHRAVNQYSLLFLFLGRSTNNEKALRLMCEYNDGIERIFVIIGRNVIRALLSEKIGYDAEKYHIMC